jgi:hypothetical protein
MIKDRRDSLINPICQGVILEVNDNDFMNKLLAVKYLI